jgi:hypothetical protein
VARAVRLVEKPRAGDGNEIDARESLAVTHTRADPWQCLLAKNRAKNEERGITIVLFQGVVERDLFLRMREALRRITKKSNDLLLNVVDDLSYVYSDEKTNPWLDALGQPCL